MKSIKRAILVILVLNLIAMLAGIGWLLSSHRVSKDRVHELTKLFEEPVHVEQARLKAEAKAAADAEAAKPKPLPDGALNSDERNLVRVEMTQVDMARLERMKREVADLQAILRQERAGLNDERAAFEQQKQEFEAMRQRLMELEGGEQFEKALSSLVKMDPADAMSILSTMLGLNDNLMDPREKKYDEVISYLSAMDERPRTAILTEFLNAGENQLAADLLESVRLRGLEAATADGTAP
jgi:hypothetical protein